jgi:hypothetical protein
MQSVFLRKGSENGVKVYLTRSHEGGARVKLPASEYKGDNGDAP